MNGTNLFKIALRALNNNKLRAFLTMLGIIIGVASVITMLAIGQGSKKSIQAQISEMGSNMIMIHPGADMRGGVRQGPSAMQTLKLTDYEACLLYTSDAADELLCVDIGGPRITKKKKKKQHSAPDLTNLTNTNNQTTKKLITLPKTK